MEEGRTKERGRKKSYFLLPGPYGDQKHGRSGEEGIARPNWQSFVPPRTSAPCQAGRDLSHPISLTLLLGLKAEPLLSFLPSFLSGWRLLACLGRTYLSVAGSSQVCLTRASEQRGGEPKKKGGRKDELALRSGWRERLGEGGEEEKPRGK